MDPVRTINSRRERHRETISCHRNKNSLSSFATMDDPLLDEIWEFEEICRSVNPTVQDPVLLRATKGAHLAVKRLLWRAAMKIIVERFPQIKDMSAIREVTENVTKKQFDLMVKVDELLVAHKKFRAAATNRTANDAQRKQELSEVVKRSNRTISELQKDNAQLKENMPNSKKNMPKSKKNCRPRQRRSINWTTNSQVCKNISTKQLREDWLMLDQKDDEIAKLNYKWWNSQTKWNPVFDRHTCSSSSKRLLARVSLPPAYHIIMIFIRDVAAFGMCQRLECLSAWNTKNVVPIHWHFSCYRSLSRSYHHLWLIHWIYPDQLCAHKNLSCLQRRRQTKENQKFWRGVWLWQTV